MTQKEKILLQFSEKKNVSVEFGEVQDLEKEVSKYENDKKQLLSVLSQISSLKTKAKKDLSDHNKTKELLYKKADSLQSKLLSLDADIKPVFSLKNQIATIHGKGFDDDVVNYVNK